MVADLSVLGNAAAVPIIIALTQFLKKNFNFTRKGDVFSLAISLLVCWGWEFYYTPEEQLKILWGATWIAYGKHALELSLVSFATWLSASKSYDLFIGDKKKAAELDEISSRKLELEQQLEGLKAMAEAAADEQPASEPNSEIDNKLRDILSED